MACYTLNFFTTLPVQPSYSRRVLQSHVKHTLRTEISIQRVRGPVFELRHLHTRVRYRCTMQPMTTEQP